MRWACGMMVVAALVSLQCGHPEPPRPSPRRGAALRLPPVSAPQEETVAVVGASRITAADVAAWMGRHPGHTRAQALERLIAQELLVQDAVAQGYGHRADMVITWKKTLAFALLAKIAAEFGPDDIPVSVLRDYYRRHRGEFDHEDRRTVLHALYVTKDGVLPDARARSLAASLSARLSAVDDVDALRAAARQVAPDLPEGAVVAEALPPIERGDPRFDPDFVRGVFAVPFPTRSVSQPVRSAFGWHVIVVREHTPAVHVPFEAARKKIARRLLVPQRQEAVRRFVHRAVQRRRVQYFDEWILRSTSWVTP